MTEIRNSKQKSMVGQAPLYKDYKVKRKKGRSQNTGVRKDKQKISNPSTVLRTGIEQGIMNIEV